MGWHLDGRVTAIFGTHTHVQTADERILPKGTAYLTDVGMTGPHDSIIGVTIEAALGRFVNGMPAKFEAATGPGRLNAVIVTADPATGKRHRDRAAQPVDAEVDAMAPHAPSAQHDADLLRHAVRRRRTPDGAAGTGAPPRRPPRRI